MGRPRASTRGPPPTSPGCCKLDPDNAAAYNLRGVAYAELGEHDKAVADFTAGGPDSTRTTPAPVFNRGLSHVRARNWEAAVADFTEAIASPRTTRRRTSSGGTPTTNCSTRTGRWPTSPRRSGWTRTARGRTSPGRWPTASRATCRPPLADATRRSSASRSRPPAYNLRAAVQLPAGDYPAALADHLAARDLDPDDPATLNSLAWLRATCPLDELRDGPQAVADATRACELTGHAVPGFLDTLAAAYAEAGRFDDAVRWQEKAVGLVPADQRAEYDAPAGAVPGRPAVPGRRPRTGRRRVS